MNLKKLAGSGLRYLTDPRYRFIINASMGRYDSWPDDEYLRKKFYAALGRELHLEDPKTFNEKLQWLKLHDRRPEYTMMVDKYLVRKYIAAVLGKEYLIPLLGVWDDPDEIDFDALPDQFVLKCNHNSGLGMCLCEDKSKLNIGRVKKELRRGLSQDYYLTGREWPYRNVPRKIICEKYMTNGAGGLDDYKIYNFNGVPKMILVCRDRFQKSGRTEDYFDINWRHLDLEISGLPNASQVPGKPEELAWMLELAKILSRGIPSVRTDFYIVNGRVYFGELTFSSASGMDKFQPEERDYTLGSWLKLPNNR